MSTCQLFNSNVIKNPPEKIPNKIHRMITTFSIIEIMITHIVLSMWLPIGYSCLIASTIQPALMPSGSNICLITTTSLPSIEMMVNSSSSRTFIP